MFKILAIISFCMGLVALGCLIILTVKAYRSYEVREQIKEKITYMEQGGGQPVFNSVAEQNSYLQGYARCKNDILNMLESEVNDD